MRPLVSYDDITSVEERVNSAVPSFAMKRKRSSANSAMRPEVRAECSSDVMDDELEVVDAEESRELTYEEIWDDSALINAWNAAAEEYEVFIHFFFAHVLLTLSQMYHGTDKNWKTEPVHKSPL